MFDYMTFYYNVEERKEVLKTGKIRKVFSEKETEKVKIPYCPMEQKAKEGKRNLQRNDIKAVRRIKVHKGCMCLMTYQPFLSILLR
jgi:hypothetical protein